MSAGTWGLQKRIWDSLELEIQVVVSHQPWVLGTQVRFSTNADRLLTVKPCLQTIYFLFFIFIYVSILLLSLSSDTPEEGIKSHYRWLQATRTSEGAVSALNHWSISPAPSPDFYGSKLMGFLQGGFVIKDLVVQPIMSYMLSIYSGHWHLLCFYICKIHISPPVKHISLRNSI